jgi:tetratricopeptide (TPR) repeat protein
MYPQALDEYDAMLKYWADGVAPPSNPGMPVEIGMQAMMMAGEAGLYQRMHGYVNGLGRPLPSDWVTAFIDLSANTLMEREEYGHAVRVLGVAIRRSSSTAMPYYYRGMARVQANRLLADGEEEDYEPAADDFERFVELSPNDSAQKRQALDLLSKIRPQ